MNINIDFNPARFLENLHYMWEGMLCIFIVIGVIILSIYGLNKLCSLKKKDAE